METYLLIHQKKSFTMFDLKPFVILILSASFWSCNKCNYECAYIEAVPSLAFLDSIGSDLLNSTLATSLEIESISSLINPDYQFEYDISEDFGGSFPSSHRLLNIINDDLYKLDDSNELMPKTWILRYRRQGSTFVDTITITPIDKSEKCCISLQHEDFRYFGDNVVSATPVDMFPIYEVVLR